MPLSFLTNFRKVHWLCRVHETRRHKNVTNYENKRLSIYLSTKVKSRYNPTGELKHFAYVYHLPRGHADHLKVWELTYSSRMGCGNAFIKVYSKKQIGYVRLSAIRPPYRKHQE